MTTDSFHHHPGLDGRAVEARRLADSIRRLLALSVTTNPSAEVTATLAAAIDELCDRLAQHLPEVPLARFVHNVEEIRSDEDPPLGAHMPYDIIVGAFNPLALPVTLEFDPPKAIARAQFTTPYEGAPGCVHGAALAGTFDVVFAAANAVAGIAGPTVRLALTFRRPTLLDSEVVFEGEVTSQTDKRVFSEGRLIQNGQVTVEAQGEFAVLDAARIAAMGKRNRPDPG